MQPLVRIGEWVKRRYFPIHLDAGTHPAETYYRDIYFEYFDRHLSTLNDGQSLDILDAGCGTGRTLIPLAQRGHRMTGIDFHKDSLRIAREKSVDAGLHAEFHDGDLSTALARLPDQHFDVAMSIEVIYTARDVEALIRDMHRVVRPGGLIMISHRTRFYYLTQCLSWGNFDDAELVARQSEGNLRKGSHRVHYNWQTLAQIDELYPRLGSKIVARYSISPFSGFGPDALARVCNTETISDSQRAQLRRIETDADPEILAASRYVLVVAQKTNPSAAD